MSAPLAITSGIPNADAPANGPNASEAAARRARSAYQGRHPDPSYHPSRPAARPTRPQSGNTSNVLATKFKGSAKETNGHVFQCYRENSTKNQYHRSIKELNG